MSVKDLLTPCLLLDQRVMHANIQRMQDHIAAAGSTLRPHLKTSKCLEVAQAITRGYGRAITVSTLREAIIFGGRGFSDILYSVAVPPGKLPLITQLLSRDLQLTVLADNAAAVAAICEHGARTGVPIPVLLEIDCDAHRSGLRADIATVAPLARTLLGSPGARFQGIMTHAGGAYECRTVDAIRTAADSEVACMTTLAGKLASSGTPCKVVSVGSTPTAALGTDFSGVTEVRAGVFVFNDLTMVNLGVCTVADIALSVLTTVIGHRPDANQIVTDSGWMSLSADLSTAGQSNDYRFGLVCDGLSGERLDDLIVVGTNQEHGLVGRRDGAAIDAALFPVGRLLRVLPVHACATAAAHGSYIVTDGPATVIAEWQRFGGW